MKSFLIVYPKKSNPKSLVRRFVSTNSVEEAIKTIYPNANNIKWKRKSEDFSHDEYLVEGILILVYGDSNV